MLQHNYSTEKINRLHTEATNARLAKEANPYMLRKALAKSLKQIANRLDTIDKETEIQFQREATA